MRVALINPPQPYLVEPGRTKPVGLMYLHSAVRNACPWARVEIRDMATWGAENVVQHLVAGQYDVYAWTATTIDYPLVEQLAQQVAGKTRSIQVLGGPHATACDDIHHIFRAVFKGEAEWTFPKFLSDLRRGKHESVYAGARINRLDYLHFPYRGGEPQGKIMFNGEAKSATIVGSRGCAHNCPFCAAGCLWPGAVRLRKAESIAREVEILRDKGGIRDFVFWDENLTSATKHLMDVCAALKPLRVHWRAQARVDTVTRAKLQAMRDAGCREIDFGIESFDDDVLAKMCKGTTAALNIRAVELAHAANIPARLYMMISTPGETYRETVRLNSEALKYLRGKYQVVCCNTYMPLPGTAIYEEPERFGVRIVSKDWSKYCFYQFRQESGEVTNEPWSPIEIASMTREEQMDNIRAMHEFVGTLDANNKG